MLTLSGSVEFLVLLCFIIITIIIIIMYSICIALYNALL